MGIPYVNGAVAAGSDDVLAVGREGGRNYVAGVAFELGETLTGSGIPYGGGLIVTGSDYKLAIFRERSAIDGTGMGQREQGLASGGIPDVGGFVGAGRNDLSAIGRKDGGADLALMPT